MKCTKPYYTLLLGLYFLLAITPLNAQDTLVLQSKYLPVNDTVLIFTPQQYNKTKNWPLLYMLHGYGGNYGSFNRFLEMQRLADEYGMILVCPDGLKESFYLNSPVKPELQWESFFIHDLYPRVLQSYAVDSSHVFITGYSMGGHGAMYIFLRNHKLFAAAASSSGVLNLNASALKLTALSRILGDYGVYPDRFKSYSALHHLDSIRFSEKKIFVDCGSKDYLLPANQEFNEACMDLWIQITFMKMTGRHNVKYWKESFLWQMEFFKRNIN
jgi:putative tributyrin esterase